MNEGIVAVNQGNHLVEINRFQLFARVGQYYLVDNMCMAIDEHLKYQNDKQGYIKGTDGAYYDVEPDENDRYVVDEEGNIMDPEDDEHENNNDNGNNDEDHVLNNAFNNEFASQYNDMLNVDHEDEIVDQNENPIEDIPCVGMDQAFKSTSKKSFLSHTLHGSRRHLRQCATNGLVIVSEKGAPHLFITMTCNKNWPEITEMLLPGQEAYDRPDITCQVFHERLKVFIAKLRSQQYFKDDPKVKSKHKIEYMMYVIEYQERGLPHAHIVIRLSDMPVDKNGIKDWVNKHINAKIPTRVQDEELREKIRSHMLHRCSNAKNGCVVNGVCKRHYDKTIINNTCFLDEKGFMNYARGKDDLKVVPHVIEMLMDLDCHCNVEWCGSSYTPIYLYKYVFKGASKLKFRMMNADDIRDDDDINLHLRGRTLSSMDAMWRLYGYHTYPRSTPAVNTIRVQTLQQMQTYTHGKQKKLTDLYVYFNRPANIDTTNYNLNDLPNMDDIKYTEFFNNYVYKTTLPARYSNPAGQLLENKEWWNLHLSNGLQVYLFKREKSDAIITRISMLYPNSGDIWYLRLLLLNISARSYDDIKTVDNVRYATFQESAIKRGLLTDIREAERCWKDAIVHSSPRELRSLFVTMTIEGFPTLPIYNNAEMRNKMIDGPIQNEDMAVNSLLQDLAIRFNAENKTLEEYGLPSPQSISSELDREKLKYSVASQNQLLQQLEEQCPNNTEQQEIFDYVKNLIDNDDEGIVFIQGPAGSGKSTLAKKIMAYCRSKGEIALGSATTGLAATNFEDFYTVHSLYQLPVLKQEDIENGFQMKCLLSKLPQRKQLVHAAKLHLIDEFPSQSRECFEAVAKELENFKGKIAVCIGDFRQIAPIVESSNKPSDIINASIVKSDLWNKFTVKVLRTNMRLQNLTIQLQRSIAYYDRLGPLTVEQQHQRQRLIDHVNKQIDYADMILRMGNGTNHPMQPVMQSIQQIAYNDATQTATLRLPNIQTFIATTDENEEITNIPVREIIDWLHPNGFEPETMHKRAIIAGKYDILKECNN